MNKPIIKISNIRKSYGQKDTATEVLKGIDLEIYPGEFVAIMGSSGSGKSTLMHTLGLLDRPTVGSYELDGESVGKLSEDRLASLRNSKLGFVFQAYNLLAKTSALDNVALPLVYSSFSNRERMEKAKAALQAVGVGHRLKNAPSQLSGGEQQRVAIARALVNDPQIIFADEPTGNLDTKSSIEVMEIIKNLNDKGKTVILVTHEDEISEYAKRVIVIRDGEIISDKVKENNINNNGLAS
ncbi:MAG: ABC transporter ATP-binding protein [Patescibacteria group bacterium]|nr:ABC transporter ATP-binding protein [Patescibacteria group bacterium]